MTTEQATQELNSAVEEQSLEALADDTSTGVSDQESTEDEALDTGEGESAEEVTPPRVAASYALPELNQLYLKGELTDPELATRRDSLLQSDNDRRMNDQRRTVQAQAEAKQRDVDLQQADMALGTQITESLERLEAGADRESVIKLLGRDIADYKGKAKAIHTAPLSNAFDEVFYRVYGQSAQLTEQLNNMPVEDKGAQLYEAGWNAAMKQSGVQVEQAQAEVKQVKDNTKPRPAQKKPDTKGIKGSEGGVMTVAQEKEILKDPTSDINQVREIRQRHRDKGL